MAVVQSLGVADGGTAPEPQLLVGLTDGEVDAAYRRWMEAQQVSLYFHRWEVRRLDFLAARTPVRLSVVGAEAWLSAEDRVAYDAIGEES